MKHHRETLRIATRGRGLHDITGEALDATRRAAIDSGLATFFIRHTSASLLIQENADPAVLSDLENFMSRLVPRDTSLYAHDDEGADDMPAHIRAALTASSLSIPIQNRTLMLGTWQALYVYEHRDLQHTREVVVHTIGE